MDLEVFLLVLLAAFVHASWNAILKAASDKGSSFATMFATQAVASLCLIPFVDVPARESWPYMVTSAALAAAYVYFLQRAYRIGDFSHVYPLARGVSPLLVALASVLVLGEEISLTAQIAILLISVGIVSLSLSRGTDGLRDLRPVFWALGTSCFIASYSVIDGIGARVSGTPHGYVVWVTLILCCMVLPALWVTRRNAGAPVSARARRLGIIAGLLSYGVAWIVIWAMTKAPLPLVSALRETSVVFAVVIGITVFKERVLFARMASIAMTLAGTALLKFGR